MRKIPRLQSSGIITREQWDRIASVFDANFREVQLQPGVGCTITRGSGGQTVNVTAQAQQSKNYPFQLIVAKASPTVDVRVVTGLLAGGTPTGFSGGDDPPFILTDCDDGDIVFATIEANVGSFSVRITNRTIEKAQVIPDDVDTGGSLRFHYRLGSVKITTLSGGGVAASVENDSYGPVNAAINYRWFTSPEKYSCDWSATGYFIPPYTM